MFDDMQAEEVQQTTNSIRNCHFTIAMDIYGLLIGKSWCIVSFGTIIGIYVTSAPLGHSGASNQGVAEGRYHDLGTTSCWIPKRKRNSTVNLSVD